MSERAWILEYILCGCYVFHTHGLLDITQNTNTLLQASTK